jgi:hypothetical protein
VSWLSRARLSPSTGAPLFCRTTRERTIPGGSDGPSSAWPGILLNASYCDPADGVVLMRFFRFIGVADIASVRFSLPSQLLEPRPNLEYVPPISTRSYPSLFMRPL